jgi:hypothetical protein
MESTAHPNAGTRSRSCGVVEAASSAEGAGWSGLVSEATRIAPLTVVSNLHRGAKTCLCFFRSEPSIGNRGGPFGAPGLEATHG